MPETVINFQDNMEVQAADFINMQQGISDSIDHIVFDAIESGSAYAGLAVIQNAPTQITISAGRLYVGGVVYVVVNPTVIDLFSNLPISQGKQISVVAWGTTI